MWPILNDRRWRLIDTEGRVVNAKERTVFIPYERNLKVWMTTAPDCPSLHQVIS